LFLNSNNFTCINGIPYVSLNCSLNNNPWDCQPYYICDWHTIELIWPNGTCVQPCPNATNLQQIIIGGFAYVPEYVFVPGNFSVPLNSTLEISINGYLNISGCLTFNGSLVIDVNNKVLHSKQTINSIEASCFYGFPQSVQLVNVNACQKLKKVSHTIIGDLLEIVAGVDDVCASSNQTSIIIGIVVGVIGLFLLVVAIVLAIPSLRYKVLPSSQKTVTTESIIH